MARSKTHNTKADQDENSWLETILVVAGALILALLVQAFLIKPYKIPSPSMVPTLTEGQRILVNRVGNNFGDPKLGDIVVFNPPAGVDPEVGQLCATDHPEDQPCLKAVKGKFDEAYVKRVVGLPGDRLVVVNGNVTRNGKALDEPYAQRCDDPACNLKEFTVPKGTYFMMGDNRGNSEDSRFWGPLPRDYVIGKAFATYWPPKRIGGL